MIPLAEQVILAAKERGITIATAESCTGGLVSAALTDIAGSSASFERGYVTYSNTAKVEMLGVSQATLDAHGAVSEETAKEMCEGARLHARTAVAVATTGIAGPGGSDFKPEGRVCFGVTDGTETFCQTIEFGALGRENVRSAATEHALQMLLDRIISISHSS